MTFIGTLELVKNFIGTSRSFSDQQRRAPFCTLKAPAFRGASFGGGPLEHTTGPLANNES